MHQARVLLLVSLYPAPTLREDIAAGKQPRRDYETIKQALGADVLYLSDVLKTRSGRFIKKLFGARIALAWTGFLLRHEYDIFYSDTELVALPFALLLKLSYTPAGTPRHVSIAHYLNPLKKRIFFYLGVGSHFDTLIVHCTTQHILAINKLHMPAERVVKLPYFADHHFWKSPDPEPVLDDNSAAEKEQMPMICAGGQEFRDYPTLLKAVEGLKVKVQIANGNSPIHFLRPERGTSANFPSIPPNVSVGGYDYIGMRRLYAAARFVVVPLYQTDFQAGIATILEAMAMGKAVIASGTRGQTEVLRDPRNHGYGLVVRERWPGFLDTPGIAETLGSLPTGFYVTPGDAEELRERIQYLLDHPEVAEEYGRNGRRVVEACFSLEAFTQRFEAAILGKRGTAVTYANV